MTWSSLFRRFDRPRLPSAVAPRFDRRADGFHREPRLSTILKVNLSFVYSGVLLVYGWLCWQWASREWWGLGVAAILAFAGGAVGMIAAVHRIVAIILRQRKIDAFTDQGGAARADKMAGDDDLKKRGMIR